MRYCLGSWWLRLRSIGGGGVDQVVQIGLAQDQGANEVELWLIVSSLSETFAKRLFLLPALFANAHLLLNKLRFAA